MEVEQLTFSPGLRAACRPEIQLCFERIGRTCAAFRVFCQEKCTAVCLSDVEVSLRNCCSGVLRSWRLKTEVRTCSILLGMSDRQQACSSLVGAVNEAGCASAQGEMQWFSPSMHLLSINMRWKLIFLSVSHVKSLKSVLFYFSPVVPGRFVTSSANVCFLWWRKRSHSGLWNTAALYMSCL